MVDPPRHSVAVLVSAAHNRSRGSGRTIQRQIPSRPLDEAAMDASALRWSSRPARTAPT